jgi:primosomal protein N' (replication factor Y)
MVHTTEKSKYFADVVLPLAIPNLLTYHIPLHFQYPLPIGSRVMIGLGNKKLLTAIVLHCHQAVPPYTTKPILDVLDDRPIINDYQITFFKWMASYYMCSLGEVFKAALPSGFKLTGQSKIYLVTNRDKVPAEAEKLSEAARELLQQLARVSSETGISYQQIEQWIGTKLVYPTVKELLQANYIFLKGELQDKYIPKKEAQVSLRADFLQDDGALQTLFEQLEAAPKQLAVLLEYMRCIGPKLSHNSFPIFISKKDLLARKLAPPALQTLLKKNIFIEQLATLSRIAPMGVAPLVNTPILSQAQQATLQAIETHFLDKTVVVLHGITGSGKTEIYTKLIQQVCEKGGQVLYLLPEIAIATQIVQRLQNKFTHPIGVYHSKYDANERLEIWDGLLKGNLQLVIGARSAIFLPFNKLQLIIVDEEHESAYKQWEKAPRYHARDAALMLAHYYQAKVILGSATPSIETYYKAQKGKYALVELQERFQKTNLPEVTIVNMQAERQRHRVQGLFSETLRQALETTLKNKEQAIIFQNRRGYAMYLLCQACSWIPMCVQCSVSLTYHQRKHCLACHYCGYHTSLPLVCGACQSPSLRNKGFGTEKLEESLQALFPDQKIQRMDLDTTRKKTSYQQIITNLTEGRTAILVGTQMVTKGLDFGKVALVGIVDIDGLLYFPDFRAHERSFQLVMQVGGRAGRREKQGQVIIQTNNPSHPILTNLLAHDYIKMYRKELADRHTFRYPPYVRLIKTTFQSLHEALAMQAAQTFKNQLAHFISPQLLLGPQAPLIPKIKNLYRVDLWIKVEKMTPTMLDSFKAKLIHERQEILHSKQYRSVEVLFDVDPL